ncbi:MAG: hypothetical protein BWY76_01735 [bacterium ADurb.Bin429]|nr:MAG: hypothetical protein BWY76_01735 [bacterium ADurb.Bin429]
MANHRTEISRLLKIHYAIASGERPTVADLVDRCGVGLRSIKRDIAVLKEEFHAPIAVSRTKGEEGYFYERPFRLAPEPFSDQELLALSMALQIAETFYNSPFVPAIKGALEKLRHVQIDAGCQATNEIAGHVSLLAEPAPPESIKDTIHFNDLLKAIEQRQQVRMKYYTMSRDEETERVIDPYHLYHYDGLWYVYGHCHFRSENRDFAINRIRALTLLPTTFTPPSQEDIRRQLGLRFANITDEPVTVAIWFDKEAARRIRERVWHSSQQIDVADDGSCVLTMTVTGLDTVTRWVLSFGQHALPRAPKRFVNKVQKAVKAMAVAHELFPTIEK